MKFNRLLHFGAHCSQLRRKVCPRIALLRRMTGRSWGLTEQQCKVVANGYVRRALEYATGAWLPAISESHLELVDRELRAAARVVTGCWASLERLADLPQEATWIWRDRSADGGVLKGEEERSSCSLTARREVRVATETLCSSTHAELFAPRATLEYLANIEDRGASNPVVGFWAVLALLQSGPAARRTPVEPDIWSLLTPLARGG